MPTSPEGPPSPVPEGQVQGQTGGTPEQISGTPLEDVSHYLLWG